MIFKNSHLIYLFFMMPLLFFLVYVGYSLRRLRLTRFIRPELWPKLLPSLSYSRRFWKRLLWLMAVALVILAMMRPQYGLKRDTISTKGREVFIALDVSKSMLAKDNKPSRLQQAKQHILGLIDTLKGDRIGLIAFAGDAFVQCPLTSDYAALRLFLDDMSVGSISKAGTDIATAIKIARQSFNKKRVTKIIIIFSDGESFENDPIASARVAAEHGVIIYTVGVGSVGGEPIPVYTQNGQQVGYKKDKDGQVILSKLNQAMLKKIAKQTGGQFFLSDAYLSAVDRLYRAISKHEKQNLEEQVLKTQIDRHYLPLCLAFFILIADFLLSERKKEKHFWKKRT